VKAVDIWRRQNMRRGSVICTNPPRPRAWHPQETPLHFTCLFFFCLLLLTSCSTSTTATTQAPTPTPDAAPQHFNAHTFLQGVWKPDDLAFDPAGTIWFSDGVHGTIDRINPDRTVSILVKGMRRPEGVVILPDNTVVFAEQVTNRIFSFTPGAAAPTLLRQMPGTASSAPCKDGINGIAFDPTTNTLIIPDSPTGDVYRLSLDGKTQTLLASGMARPDSAVVDKHGTVYIDDECGGSIWRVPRSGAITHIGGFGMLDDIVIDPHGNLLVTDVSSAIHALIRVNLVTGKREILASQGYEKPEGLLVDAKDDIYLADDDVGKIEEYIPA
jgi:sugar lactone lactonase YvrE